MGRVGVPAVVGGAAAASAAAVKCVLASQELRAESGHLVFHFAHLVVEALTNRVELRVQHAEVVKVDGDDVLPVGHL